MGISDVGELYGAVEASVDCVELFASQTKAGGVDRPVEVFEDLNLKPKEEGSQATLSSKTSHTCREKHFLLQAKHWKGGNV